MFYELIKSNPNLDSVPISPSYTKLSRTEVVKDGMLVQKSEYKVSECVAVEGMTYKDFEIQNLIAIGADLSKPVVMSVNSDMNFVDSFEKFQNAQENAAEK